MNPAPTPSSPAPGATVVLDQPAIERCLKRIAHEIIERNPDLSKVALIGIPSRGIEIAKVANCKGPETQRAINAAQQALPGWRAKTAKERAAAMRRWFELISAHQEDLAKLMTAEQGKPMTESRGEVVYGTTPSPRQEFPLRELIVGSATPRLVNQPRKSSPRM